MIGHPSFSVGQCGFGTLAPKRKRKVPSIASPEARNNVPVVSTEAAAALSNRVTPPKKGSPSVYDTRLDQMQECLEAAGRESYELWTQYCVFDVFPDKREKFLEEMGLFEDEMHGCDEDIREKVTDRLTLKEVDQCYNTMLVPTKMITLMREYDRELDPNYIYWNSHTGTSMIPIIQKQFIKADSVLHKAIEFVQDLSKDKPEVVVPNVARDAFLMVYAAITVCHEVGHWRINCEDVDGAHEIARKASKMLQDLLWFHDEELGIIDPFTRTSMINRLKRMVEEWKTGDSLQRFFDYWKEMEQDISDCVLKDLKLVFGSAKNNHGKGRTLTTSSGSRAKDGPAAKRPRTTASSNIAPEDKDKLKELCERLLKRIHSKEEYIIIHNKLLSAEKELLEIQPRLQPPTTPAKRDNVVGIFSHLEALGEKLPERCKTYAQLLVYEEDNTKRSCQFVCSGSFSLEKLSQLVAFLTGHVYHYDYGINRVSRNRETSLDGCYFEISVDGGKNVLWVGDSAIQKKAYLEGAGYAVDKTIKIAQVFQGLITSKSGTVYDADKMKYVCTTFGMNYDSDTKDISLTWVSDKGDRFSVIAQGIIAIESCPITYKTRPLPRVVDEDYFNTEKKTGFQKSIRRVNKILRGDRDVCAEARVKWNKEAMEAMMTSPICNADGTKVYDEYAFSKAWC